ncbi:MAG: hypothetical protein HON65_12345, partial [Rhodospirillales bacterium]|nr:hypothetical protein [Rhodospirillales bacterium]
MRYFHRKHILVIAAFLILGVLFSAAKELHTIWVIRYATLYSLTDNQSLMTKFINSAEAYFQTKVLANQDKGLPFVRLYIPEQA